MDPSIERDEVSYILSRYLDRHSSVYLQQNESKLFKKIKSDASMYPTDFHTIQNFKQSLSYYSRVRDRYRLKGKRRYSSFRRYTTFSPGTMLAGKHMDKDERKDGRKRRAKGLAERRTKGWMRKDKGKDRGAERWTHR